MDQYICFIYIHTVLYTWKSMGKYLYKTRTHYNGNTFVPDLPDQQTHTSCTSASIDSRLVHTLNISPSISYHIMFFTLFFLQKLFLPTTDQFQSGFAPSHAFCICI